MGSVNDWAAQAAKRICNEYGIVTRRSAISPAEDRIAAIIETYARPLLNLLQEGAPAHQWRCPASQDPEAECKCKAGIWDERYRRAKAGPDFEKV